MHLSELYVCALPPLPDEAVFRFNRHVNVFLGPNASGKSTILRAINELHSLALGESSPTARDDGSIRVTNDPIEANGVGTLFFNDDNILDGEPIVVMQASEDWLAEDGAAKWDTVPFLYIPAVRLNMPSQSVLGQIFPEEQDVARDAPLKLLFDTSSGIFNGRYVDAAIDWLVEQRSSGDRRLRGAIQLGYACAKSICTEVIYDPAPHQFVDSQRGFFGGEEIVAVYQSLGIGTSDDFEGTQQPLYAGRLSSGTQGTLLWVWALAIKMAVHYSWAEGWEKKPAILLIDEIENHLHPTWQRRVIPALLDHFPGLQIFATTHSPFVVAGLKAGQVHLLNRDENGVVTATPNKEDIVGWTADEILRNLMGVEDPTDDDTAAAARELRALRQELPRSDPDEEEARQERMLELRQRVDRDLLAGGPWKKQREQFEEEFSEVLQKYRQSQDLGQENG